MNASNDKSTEDRSNDVDSNENKIQGSDNSASVDEAAQSEPDMIKDQSFSGESQGSNTIYKTYKK